MTLPFTSAEFFATFAAYNAAIWPVQVVAYGIAAAVIVLLLRRSAASGSLIAALLALMWLWTGLAYHWLFFAAIDPPAVGFALGFIAQAALLVESGMLRRRIGFGYRAGLDAHVGLALVLYATVLYPLIGSWTGHHYPAAPMFGVTPCPLTIFTLGLLLLTAGRVPWRVALIPFVWSLIGGSAAFLLGVVQDWALPVSGIAAAVLLARRGGSARPRV